VKLIQKLENRVFNLKHLFFNKRDQVDVNYALSHGPGSSAEVWFLSFTIYLPLTVQFNLLHPNNYSLMTFERYPGAVQIHVHSFCMKYANDSTHILQYPRLLFLDFINLKFSFQLSTISLLNLADPYVTVAIPYQLEYFDADRY